MVLVRLALAVAAANLVLATSAAAQSPKSSELAIVGARIYPAPDAGPIDDGVVVIREGRIVSVGPRSRISIPKRRSGSRPRAPC
jgi:hypothetical protein